MNTKLILRTISFVVCMLLACDASSQSLYADVNGDGTVDIFDVNEVINVMLGKSPQPVTITYTVKGVSFTMVSVQGGTFNMGATAEQGSDASGDEFPIHQVTLSNYFIGQTEVTQGLWLAVMGSNPSWFNETGNSNYGSNHYTNYRTNLQRPVEYVTWDDCQLFITQLNQMTGMNFRLPTEAEWEFAARGGNKSEGYKYSGSNNVNEVAWIWDNIPTQLQDNASYGTQTVATKSPNELGLYDMSGNVLEWCQDFYGSYSSDAQTDPTGPTSSTLGPARVSRGGYWKDDAKSSRVSKRYGVTPSYPIYYQGLRLAL